MCRKRQSTFPASAGLRIQLKTCLARSRVLLTFEPHALRASSNLPYEALVRNTNNNATTGDVSSKGRGATRRSGTQWGKRRSITAWLNPATSIAISVQVKTGGPREMAFTPEARIVKKCRQCLQQHLCVSHSEWPYTIFRCIALRQRQSSSDLRSPSKLRFVSSRLITSSDRTNSSKQTGIILMQLTRTMAVLAFFTVRSGGDSRRPRSKRNKIKWSCIWGRTY